MASGKRSRKASAMIQRFRATHVGGVERDATSESDGDHGEGEPESGFLTIDPNSLAQLVLTLLLRPGVNLVTLAPGARCCSLVVKRGTVTVATADMPFELGLAAVVCLARAAEMDPLLLSKSSGVSGTARRLRVVCGEDHAELLLSFSGTLSGIAVEARPLLINGDAPRGGRRSQLSDCPACGAIQLSSRTVCDVDGATLRELGDLPEPGGLIGLYRLGDKMGEGGMGFVLSGKHALLGKPVAIKLLHRTMNQDPRAGRRFLAEARAASAIRHPNIVDVIDYGLLEDGRPYIVMERLEGESLQDRLDREPALEPALALLLAREMASALGAAHEANVVHLDLKPANVILLAESTANVAAQPRIKLIDFGIAEQVGATAREDLTGTPAYMSPEHARGDPADGRSDLYSLGIVLHEMLSGSLPFEGTNLWALLKAHMLNEPPVVTSPGRVLPDAVVDLVTRLLRKNPAERHQSATELIVDIDRALAALNRKEWQRWLR